MRVVLNEDKQHVRAIREALKENDNYCPCSRVKSPDTKCMCKDFRDKMDDIQFVGYCHCELYKKIEA